MATFTLGQRIARGAWRAIPKRAYSGVVGWGAGRNLPRALRASVLGGFANRIGMDMSEAEKPLAEYRGIDDLFTRRLKPDARPIDGAPDSIVGPADGTLVAVGTVTDGACVEVKNAQFEIPELLANEPEAERFRGGAFAIIYLSPRDYHRVHTPAAGRVLGFNHVPGTLFPVNEASTRREPDLFARNERVVTWIEGEVGLFAVVMVAAIGVGHITLAYDANVATHGGGREHDASRRYADAPVLARGGELGIFHLGSTAIIVFEPGRVALEPFAPGTAMRVGVRVGRKL